MLVCVTSWPCTCRLRINIVGSPVDLHRRKMAYPRVLSWPPSGPLTSGDALDASRVGAHRLCRPPPLAAFHHSCVLTLPPAAARVAHETTTLRAMSRHGPSVPPPWPASRAATVWRSPCHWSAEAVATVRVCWREANRSCSTCGTRLTAGLNPLRLCTGSSPAVLLPRHADGWSG